MSVRTVENSIQRFWIVLGYLWLAAWAASSAIAGDHWPQFRGPGARGISEESAPPDRWSATQNVSWKFEDAGRGWSSPVVWGHRVFLTTVVNTGKSEPPKKGLYFGGERPTPPEAEHLWKVLCLELETGKLLWERVVHQGTPPTGLHIKNSYASETPVTDGERIYACFGNVGLFCLDMDGIAIWSKKLESRRTKLGWGTAASPALHGDRVYFVNDNEDQSYMLALDKRTGETIWRIDRDEKSNWATPFVWTHEGRTEIVTPGSRRVRSYDLDGKPLWELAGMSSITIATPYSANGLLYVTSGYVLDPLKPIYAIRPGASGNISVPQGENRSEFVAWSQRQAGPYNPSTVVLGNRLYVLYDMSLFACFDAETGKEIYSKKRIPNGKQFTSSPWAYGGKIFCLNEDGVTFVIKAGDDFEILHSNPLADDDMGMASPAIVGNRLLLRTAKRLYCIAQP